MPAAPVSLMQTSGSASNAHLWQMSGVVGMQYDNKPQPHCFDGLSSLKALHGLVMPLLGKAACLTIVKVVAATKVADGDAQAGAVAVPSAQHIVWLAIQPGHLALMHALQALQDNTVMAVPYRIAKKCQPAMTA